MMVEKYWGEKKPPVKKGAQPNGVKPEKHISVHENKIYYYSKMESEIEEEAEKLTEEFITRNS